MLSLSNYTEVVAKKSQFNTDKYLQVKRGQRWVNVSLKSWQKLKILMPEISKAVKDEEAYKADLYSTWSGSQSVIVMKYEDKMYVGLHAFDKAGERERGKGINLFVDEWAKCE